MLSIVDATCVKVLTPDTILIGQGNQLLAFKALEDGSTQKLRIPVHFRNKIYGIETLKCSADKHRILVFGGKEIALLSLQQMLPKIVGKTILSDFVNSALIFAGHTAKIEIAAITSHNVAVQLEISEDSSQFTVCTVSPSEDNSTIYSSSVYGKSWNACIVLSGTPLGEVLVWKPETQDKGRAPILHRIYGHNGVIFSIDLNFDHGIMTTTSDDRSVKIWKVHGLQKNTEDLRKCTFGTLRSIFGHKSRVFKSKIIEEGNDVFVISVGEDSSVCLWNLKGVLLVRKQVYGGTIWGVDYDSEAKVIYASCSNGSTHQINIAKVLCGRENLIVPITVTILMEKENLVKVKFIDNNKMVVLTSHHRLLLRGNDEKWCEILQLNDFKCTVLKTFDNTVCLAGHRRLIIFSVAADNQIEFKYDEFVSNGFIRSVHIVDASSFIFCNENGNASILNTKTKDLVNFQIPKCKEMWITSLLMVNTILLVGDRCGNLHAYTKNGQNYEKKYGLPRVHGNLGITDIQLIETDKDVIKFLTSGHDGTVKEIRFDWSQLTMDISRVQKTPVAWIDRIYRGQLSAWDYFIAGFSDNQFQMWSEAKGIFTKIECGGGHRSWDLRINTYANSCAIVFIRRKVLNSINIEISDELENRIKLPKHAWHIKSCNALRVHWHSPNRFLLLTGGDDNVLKITECIFDSTVDCISIEKMTNVYTHLSSIKTIHVAECDDDSNRFDVFSGGGRSQMCATEIVFKDGQIEVQERVNFMLAEVEGQKQISSKRIDPETRFMSICANSLNKTIIAACSDGLIIEFEHSGDQLHVVSRDGIKYNKCLINVACIECNRPDRPPIVISMGTDGAACFWLWHTQKPPALVYRLELHQSGINCYDICYVENDDDNDNDNSLLATILLATGGDDQCIVVTKLSIRTVEKDSSRCIEFCNVETKHFDFIHSAQVSGLRFANETKLFSTSVDQRVCEFDLATEQICRVWSTCVSDVKGICLEESMFIVFGSGIEIIKR